MPKKIRSGDRGINCFGLLRAYWQDHGLIPTSAICRIFPSSSIDSSKYWRQVQLLSPSVGVTIQAGAVDPPPIPGDVLLFSIYNKAIDLLGIYNSGDTFHYLSPDSVVLGRLTRGWIDRMIGVIRCQ